MKCQRQYEQGNEENNDESQIKSARAGMQRIFNFQAIPKGAFISRRRNVNLLRQQIRTADSKHARIEWRQSNEATLLPEITGNARIVFDVPWNSFLRFEFRMSRQHFFKTQVIHSLHFHHLLLL